MPASISRQGEDPAPSESTILIVGGGASGILAAAQILLQARHPLLVAIVDPLPIPESGTAYTTTDPVHLLNVRASHMSAHPGDPGHFVRWLASPSNCAALVNRSGYGPGDFVPRGIYARYISHTLEEAARKALPHGAAFERIADHAVDYEQTGPHSGVLTTRSGRTVRAAHLVLATGNPRPRNPLPGHEKFFASPRYIRNVWTPGLLDSIAPDEHLLLAGTGLTALDVLATLRRRAHRGRIEMVSRHGLVPAEHAPPGSAPDFAAALPWPRTARGWLALLREQVDPAKSGASHWQHSFDTLRPHTRSIWQSLPPAEKKRFLRHLRAYWECLRHRSPEQTRSALSHFQAAGQLSIRAGRITGLHEDPQGATVSIRPRGASTGTSLRVHRVLNCIGPDTALHHSADPFLQNLLRRGSISADPLHLGLAAEPDGMALDSGGRPNPGISTLGPTLRGVLWETTAIPEIRTQARDLAARILLGVSVPAWSI